MAKKPAQQMSFFTKFGGYTKTGNDEASNLDGSLFLKHLEDAGDPQARLFASTLRKVMDERDRLDEEQFDMDMSIGEKTKKKKTVGWLTREPLIALASLVTGRWGPQSFLHKGDAGFDLKIAAQDFPQRMLTLESSLAMAAAERGVSPEATAVLAKMGAGVQFLLDRIAAYQQTGDPSVLTIWADNGMPLGLKWTVVSKGNGKLPFTAYSELPMATCPGAGACAVYADTPERADTPKRAGYRGYCYSFRAWRYADSFARQFLNTLANEADMIFRAVRGEGGLLGQGLDRTRVRRNPAPVTTNLSWKQFVVRVAATMTAKTRVSQVSFLRLFVDGDMSSVVGVKEWMEAVRSLGKRGKVSQEFRPKNHEGRMKHMEVYGYSKAWSLFTKVDSDMGSDWWPDNYTVNLSEDSVFKDNAGIRARMESLPISRGYFKSVNFKGAITDFVAKLKGRTISAKTSDAGVQKIVSEFGVLMDLSDPELTWQQVWAIAESIGLTFKKPASEKGLAKKGAMRAEQEDRSKIFENWFVSLLQDERIHARTDKELRIDFGDKSVEKFKARTKAEIEKGLPAGEGAYKGKMKKKIVALALDDVLWAYGQGGSCPLICGNCYDVRVPKGMNDTEAREYVQKFGVHRCASKPGSLFGRTRSGQLGAAIHIGLH